MELRLRQLNEKQLRRQELQLEAFYPSRGEAVGQVTDSEEIKSERFLFRNLCNIIDPMTMHILAHLYFGDLVRCVFCTSDVFVIQNQDSF